MNKPAVLPVPVNLICCGAVNPAAVPSRNIELEWSFADHGTAPDCFCVEMLLNGKVFSSGWIHSTDNHYHPDPAWFAPRQKWSFRVGVKNSKSALEAWSSWSVFETGLLDDDQWTGQWIGYPGSWNGNSLFFQFPFDLDCKPEKLRLYLSGLGCCRAWIDGNILSHGILSPATTNYSKHICYQSFILPELDAGPHMLAVEAGNGWYGHVQIRFQLEADDRVICNSKSFTYSVTRGAYTANSIYDGVIYDDRKILPDSAYTADGFISALDGWPMVMPDPGGKMTPQMIPEVLPKRELRPVKIVKHSNNCCMIDFGENISGYCRTRIDAPYGEEITIRYAEAITPDLHVDQRNLLIARATDTFISSGVPRLFEPQFTTHGFRYAEISGNWNTFNPEKDILAIETVGDFYPSGSFECSNDLLNQIYRLVNNTEKYCLNGIPSDCPQRSERLGWINDLLAHSENTTLMFDAGTMWEKYIVDVMDSQFSNGKIPLTIPLRWDLDEVEPVCSGFLDILLLLYRYYGRTETIFRAMDTVKNWIMCLCRECQSGIYTTGGIIGDWVPPEEFSGNGCRNATVPKELVATALVYRAINQAVKLAQICKDRKFIRYCRNEATKIRNAFNQQFCTEHGKYADGSQASQVYALACGLVPDQERNAAFKILSKHFEASRVFALGNIGLAFLWRLLNEFDRADLGLKIINSTEYPGWGYMLSCGATTLWERWENRCDDGMCSLNHPMFGAIGEYFVTGIAGLRVDDDACGGDKITFAPRLFREIPELKCAIASSRGRIAISWKTAESGEIELHTELPVNSAARLNLPPNVAIISGKTAGKLTQKKQFVLKFLEDQL